MACKSKSLSINGLWSWKVKKIKDVRAVGSCVNSSLNSYDLKKLFGQSSTHHPQSGGEALVQDDDDDHGDVSTSDSDNDKVMSDSISTVSWDDITNDDCNEADDDESRD